MAIPRTPYNPELLDVSRQLVEESKKLVEASREARSRAQLVTVRVKALRDTIERAHRTRVGTMEFAPV